ncbi:hypothetical protein BaRGS_00025780 [Batillaria attramentaria]|uniref:Uncharacterized protein n=1 Tax=Batillaria attramentaria TaxID=370345 RepID=A0ABD0K798_9CAEN
MRCSKPDCLTILLRHGEDNCPARTLERSQDLYVYLTVKASHTVTHSTGNSRRLLPVNEQKWTTGEFKCVLSQTNIVSDQLMSTSKSKKYSQAAGVRLRTSTTTAREGGGVPLTENHRLPQI